MFQSIYAKPLELEIKSEIAKTENFLNLESQRQFSASADFSESEAFQYSFDNKKVILRDLNNDKVNDAVVALEYCEKNNCHLTTHSYDLAIFLGGKNNQFQHHTTLNIGMTGSMDVDDNGIITVTTLSFSNSDPHCCPSQKIVNRFVFLNNKLIKIK